MEVETQTQVISKVYKTPIYTRNAVQRYEERIKTQDPERYKMIVERKKQYYKKYCEKMKRLKEQESSKE